MLTAALLFLGLAALFAFTRSHWLDDWDSVNFAFGLDDFDVTKHWPHPPGYPVYIAAGKLVDRVVADQAGRAHSRFRPVRRRRRFWLQSGLALTDMFGMVFVVAFLKQRRPRLAALS